MTDPNTRATTVALLALASAAESFGQTLREIVKRELAATQTAEPSIPEPGTPEPCVQPVFEAPAASEATAVQAQSLAITQGPTPAPGAGAPVFEYHDVAGDQVWLIDEVGNVSRNGYLLYVAPPQDPALTLSRIGGRLWFRTQLDRWFAFDGDKPVLQSSPPKEA